MAKKAVATKAIPKKAIAKSKPLAKKPAAKRPAASARTAPKSTTPVKRRDGAGHLDPSYAKGLRRQSSPHEPEGEAFVNGNHADDDLAEGLGEEVVEKATTGEDDGEDVANQEVTEDRGGPFVITTGGTEFADGVDESNPASAEREPFPKV